MFRILIIFVILDYKPAVLYENVCKSLVVARVHGQHGVVEVLGDWIVLLPHLELNETLISLKRRNYLANLFVHFPGLIHILPLLYVTPVEIHIPTELHKESLIVPQNAQDFCVFVRLVLQVVESLIPKVIILSLGHQRSFITIADVLNNTIFPLQL